MAGHWRLIAAGAVLVVLGALGAAQGAPSTTPGQPSTTTSSGASLGGLSVSEGLSLGQTAPIPNPSIKLTKPVDENLNGYQFSLHVLGYGEAPYLSSDFGAYSAPAGATIAVVSYDLEYEGNDGGNAELAFVADGQSFPIADSELQGQWTVGVAVPDGGSIVLTASEEGLTEELSLATGTRVGPSPQELYRSPAGPDLTEQVGETASIRVVGRSGSFRAVDQLTVDSVVLTYFSPIDPTIQPSSVNGAFLVVNASEETAPTSPYGLIWEAALPPGRMRLVLPGGRVIEADPSSTPNDPDPANLLDGTYFFDVPGRFTRGTIEITPGTYGATEILPGGVGGADGPVTALGTASFPVAFPPPPKVVTAKPLKKPSKAAAASSRTAPTTALNPGSGSTTRHHSSVPLVPLVVVLLVVVVGWAFLRRRRRRGPVAVDSNLRRVMPPPALPAVLRPELMPGPAVGGRDGTVQTGNDESGVTNPPARSDSTDAPGAGSAWPDSDDSETAPVVYLLGPIEIWPCLESPTRKKVVELCCYLACHTGRRYTAEQLSAVLWPPEISDRGRPKSARTYASMLRQAIGSEHFPEGGDAGYALSPSVTTDAARFAELVKASRSAPPSEARERLRRALGLVRGEPFGGTDYTWVSDERLVEPIEIAIVAAARELVARSLEAGDVETAWFAVDRGLLVSRATGLCEDLLRTAAATGDRARFDRAWKRVERMVSSDPDLVALRDELRRGLG
jgi:hypothetical protein